MRPAAMMTRTICAGGVIRMPRTSKPADWSRTGNASGFGPKTCRTAYSRVNETPMAVISTASRGLLRSGR